MSTQPEALRLADAIDPLTRRSLDNLTCSVAADELRRLHAANIDCVAHFNAIKAERDELLEALQGVFNACLLANEDESIPFELDGDLLDAARSAITKATGDAA